MRIEVYRNLHKKCLSVRLLEGIDKGKVISHEQTVMIWMPTFVVQKAGMLKVRATNNKNVHAFIRGQWLQQFKDQLPDDVYKTFDKNNMITYNPYKYESIVTVNNEQPIYNAQFAIVGSNGIFVETG